MTQSDPAIDWPQVRKFIGQLNHDLRNYLNAIELQAAFLGEIATSDEQKSEIKRLREMTAQLGAHLQRLSDSLKRPQPEMMTYLARELVEDLQAKLASAQPEGADAIEWQVSLGEEKIEIDPQLLQEAFLEIFANAALHGRAEGALIFSAHSTGETVEFSLREPKAKFDGALENWGVRPLEQIRHGHYGLGLFRVRGILEQHHGTLRAQFEPAASVLVTSIVLPRA